MGCLTNCYQPAARGCGIKKPIDSEGLAPYVKICFPPIPGEEDGGSFEVGTDSPDDLIDEAPRPPLSVGNDSNPDYNFAVIKSFQYGASDGNGAEVEIVDEEGGSFNLFVKKLVKVLPNANNYGVMVRWGWIKSKCAGTKCTLSSSPHYFLILNINISYEKGLISFKLELLDMMTPLFETRASDAFGEDGGGAGLPVQEAIRELFKKTTPAIKSVSFISAETAANTFGCPPNNCLLGPGGCLFQNLDAPCTFEANADDIEFVNAHGEAPWEAKGMNPLEAVRSWLNTEITKKNKGVIIFWDSTCPKSQLIIMEDPLPDCWKDVDGLPFSRNIGTYIVNGGAESPVLSFSPQIKFTFATAANAGGGQDSESAEEVRPEPADRTCPENEGRDDPPGSGSNTFITIPRHFIERHGDNPKLAARAIAANEKANKMYENIEAELTIQGDPSLDDPFVIKTKTVAIWVINPIHLLQWNTSAGACPIWTYLTGPPCNGILSNNNWFIKGVAHDIKEGSYTTTLKLYLPAPCQNNTT